VAVGNMTRLNHDLFILSIVMWDGTLAQNIICTVAQSWYSTMLRMRCQLTCALTPNARPPWARRERLGVPADTPQAALWQASLQRGEIQSVP